MTEAMPASMSVEALFELLSLKCHVDSDSTVHYHNALGQLHRVFGPAVEHSNGYRAWWQNGQRHRLDGPAVEYPDGSKFWYQNGKLHRLDGPAAEYPDGDRAWYINGRALTEAELVQQVASMERV